MLGILTSRQKTEDLRDAVFPYHQQYCLLFCGNHKLLMLNMTLTNGNTDIFPLPTKYE